MPIDDEVKRDFYATMCKNENWSVRTLRRLVLIELKLGEIEPQDKGQVELYLRWLNKYEKAEGENNPVALILCAEKSQETIELLELDGGDIHVGQYFTKMPPKKLLEEKLSQAILNAREQLENRGIDN